MLHVYGSGTLGAFGGLQRACPFSITAIVSAKEERQIPVARLASYHLGRAKPGSVQHPRHRPCPAPGPVAAGIHHL